MLGKNFECGFSVEVKILKGDEMSAKTCFVIMAIGDQHLSDGTVIKKEELKDKYDNLIKEAIQKANSSIEVVRADEISAPGTMSTDIVTRIMHSDYVIADISYPNPNVFYELGLRHACKPGTIIIKEKGSASVPFDISHLRHIEFENTTNGLKALSEELKKVLAILSAKPDLPDNQFLELARLTNYQYPEYAKDKEKKENDAKKALFKLMLSDPDTFQAITDAQKSGDPAAMMKLIAEQPEMIDLILEGLS